MDSTEQVRALSDELDSLFNRYKDEFDLSFAEILGILYMKAHLVAHEAIEQQDRGENDPELEI